MKFVAYLGKSLNQKATNEAIAKLTELTFNDEPYRQLRTPGVMLTTPYDLIESEEWLGVVCGIALNPEGGRENFEAHLKTIYWGVKKSAVMLVGDKKQELILFNGDKTDQSLHVIDVRPTLGQIWVCSSAQLWRDAVNSCPSLQALCPHDQLIIEFPPQQMWVMQYMPEEKEYPWSVRKFKISRRALLKGLECKIE